MGSVLSLNWLCLLQMTHRMSVLTFLLLLLAPCWVFQQRSPLLHLIWVLLTWLPTLLCNFQQHSHSLLLAWAYLARLPAPLHGFRQCCLLLIFAWAYMAQLPAPLHSFQQCCLVLFIFSEHPT